MKCPKCGSTDSRCWESKNHEEYRHRRYTCNSCSTKYGTREIVFEVKNDGDYHYTSTVAGDVDPKIMLDSIKRPFLELMGVMRTYDKLLK